MTFYEYNNNNGNNSRKHIWIILIGYTMLLEIALLLFALINSGIGIVGLIAGVAILLYPLIHHSIFPIALVWWEKHKGKYHLQYRLVPVKAEYRKYNKK